MVAHEALRDAGPRGDGGVGAGQVPARLELGGGRDEDAVPRASISYIAITPMRFSAQNVTTAGPNRHTSRYSAAFEVQSQGNCTDSQLEAMVQRCIPVASVRNSVDFVIGEKISYDGVFRQPGDADPFKSGMRLPNG